MNPEPYASLKRFVKEARKAERESTVGGRIPGQTAGEILFGSMTVHGKKTLHRMSIETDKFIDAVSKYGGSMKCRYCEKEMVTEEVCASCKLLYELVKETPPRAVEKIVKEIAVNRFMKERVR